MTFFSSHSFPECALEDRYGSSAQPTCRLSPLLDKYIYSSKFHNKFMFINSTRKRDVMVTLSENTSQIVPFYIQDKEDNGGSLVLTGQTQMSVSIEVTDFVELLYLYFLKQFAVQCTFSIVPLPC